MIYDIQVEEVGSTCSQMEGAHGTMTRMATVQEPVLPRRTRTVERALPTVTGWAAGALGCAGMALVAWEVATGPTTTPDGAVQDHGGYLLGVPLLLAAVIATLTLVAGRRGRASDTTSVLHWFAALVVSAPLLAMAGAAASGVLTFDLLTIR
jgi:hypothetical protein